MSKMIFGTYFKTVDEATKHIEKKKKVLPKFDWYIVDCDKGCLVISESTARKSFPHLFDGVDDVLHW
jgi:hypothetical protein